MHNTISLILFVVSSYTNHNYQFIAYILGLVISLSLCIYNPSRFLIFFFIGFSILCLAFQFDKHFALQASNELLGTLKAKGSTISPEKFTLLFTSILPILIYTMGWVCIFIGIIMVSIKKKELPVPHDHIQTIDEANITDTNQPT